jgi:hypothetical protein
MPIIKIIPMPGVQGITGVTGATGPTGPIGPTGPQGTSGSGGSWQLPSFLTFTETRASLPKLNTNFGWDSSGVWFGKTATNNGQPSYPIFTNTVFNAQDKVVVEFDLVVNDSCSDFGICVYPQDGIPNWSWDTDVTRIAAQYNCPSPEIQGRESSGTSTGENIPLENNTYRLYFEYNPNATESNNIVFKTALASAPTEFFNEMILGETLGSDYRIGFAADQDSEGLRTYIKNLTISVNDNDVVYEDTLRNSDSSARPRLTEIKSQVWRYPTSEAISISPTKAGEAIAIKSQNSAALRWHIRDNSASLANEQPIIPTGATVVSNGEVFDVTFTFPELDGVPAVGYTYNITANEGYWSGSYISTAATKTSLSFTYPSDPGIFDVEIGIQIGQPSVYNQIEARQNGVWIKNANWSEPNGYAHYWQFTNEGSIHFPYGPSNSRTGYGDVLRFATSFDQSIITGAPTTESAPTANRLVIAGQDGYVDTSGEGGDIYLWAGRGGSSGGSGGDIKVDAGNSLSNGEGGTVKMRGGYSPSGQGGFVEIRSGDSYEGNGGPIYITSGYSGLATGGNIQITAQSNGKIVLDGSGGEFLNDGNDPNSQIATVGQLPTGATGSFISQDGKTITVTNGIITGIE